MSTVRKPKAVLNLEKQVEQLKKEFANEKSQKDIWYKQYQEAKLEVEGLHDILDDLGIKRFREENKYNQLSLSIRLFSWAMKLAKKE